MPIKLTTTEKAEELHRLNDLAAVAALFDDPDIQKTGELIRAERRGSSKVDIMSQGDEKSTGKIAIEFRNQAVSPLPRADSAEIPIVPAAPRLRPLQEAFVVALLKSPTCDVETAYLAACTKLGKEPADKPIIRGRQMYASQDIQLELRRRLAFIEGAVDAQAIQIEQMLARHALSDIREIENPENPGQTRKLSELPDDIAAAIVGYEEEDFVRGRGDNQESGVRRKFKLADKQSAAKILMQRRGLVREEHGSGIVARIEINL